MYCEKCGGELRQEENKLVCTKCGAEYAQEIYSESSVPEEGGVYVTPRGFSSKKHIIAIIIAAIVAVVTVTIVVVNLPKPEYSPYMGGGIEVAERFLWEQNYEQAVIEFEKVLEIEPMNVDAYLGLADAYIGLGEKEKALEILRKGLELTGDSRLQKKIDELTVPKIVYGDAECLTIEEMIEAYLRGEGEIDSSKLKDVTSLEIYGTDVVIIGCGYRNGTRTDGLFSWNDDTFTPVFVGSDGSRESSREYNWGNIGSIWEDLPFIYNIPSLEELSVHFNQITDVSQLSGITNLTSLDLWNNQISDITPLAGLTNLTRLNLSNNQISDITPLSGLISLFSLSLNQNQISDITPLAGLTNLTGLYLSNNQISDITPLAGLTKLTGQLWLGGNQISDITPLAGLTNLTELDLACQVIENEGGIRVLSDITPLAGLKNLIDLTLYSNEISDLMPLSGLTNLKGLSLGDNRISDLTPLAGLTNLTSLDLWYNEISDITPLAKLTKLEDLMLHDNQISGADIDWLKTQLPNW